MLGKNKVLLLERLPLESEQALGLCFISFLNSNPVKNHCINMYVPASF